MPTIPLLDLKIGLADNYDDSKRIFPGIVPIRVLRTWYPDFDPFHIGPCVPDGLDNNLIETPELPADNSVEDSINKIFENVPVSLGKQHFSPKLGSHKNLLPNELPKNGRPLTVW